MAIKIEGESWGARTSIEFRVLFATTFAAFLVGAVISRLRPSRWQAEQGAARRVSVIGEAKAAAAASVPFAFMG